MLNMGAVSQSDIRDEELRKENELLRRVIAKMRSQPLETGYNELVHRRVQVMVLQQKLKQKSLSELGYVFIYYFFNTLVALTFVAGIKSVSMSAEHPVVARAFLWIVFALIFLPILGTYVIYYTNYFDISKKIKDEDFVYINSESEFPCFVDNKSNDSLWTKVKNWIERVRKPENSSVMLKSYVISAVLLSVFSFMQYVCHKGVAFFFSELQDTERVIAVVTMTLMTSVALCMMFIMLRYILDRMLWSGANLNQKNAIIRECLFEERNTNAENTGVDVASSHDSKKERVLDAAFHEENIPSSELDEATLHSDAIHTNIVEIYSPSA